MNKQKLRELLDAAEEELEDLQEQVRLDKESRRDVQQNRECQMILAGLIHCAVVRATSSPLDIRCFKMRGNSGVEIVP